MTDENGIPDRMCSKIVIWMRDGHVVKRRFVRLNVMTLREEIPGSTMTIVVFGEDEQINQIDTYLPNGRIVSLTLTTEQIHLLGYALEASAEENAKPVFEATLELEK